MILRGWLGRRQTSIISFTSCVVLLRLMFWLKGRGHSFSNPAMKMKKQENVSASIWHMGGHVGLRNTQAFIIVPKTEGYYERNVILLVSSLSESVLTTCPLVLQLSYWGEANHAKCLVTSINHVPFPSIINTGERTKCSQSPRSSIRERGQSDFQSRRVIIFLYICMAVWCEV